MGVETDRAQRWHDTDHGAERGKPLRPNRFRIPRAERETPVPPIWSGCELCDPHWNPDRSNPYWFRAVNEQPIE